MDMIMLAKMMMIAIMIIIAIVIDDEKYDENELITKSHAAAICTTHYLHNQRGLKVNILWVFFGYSLNILWIFKSLVQQQYAQLTISTIRGGLK